MNCDRIDNLDLIGKKASFVDMPFPISEDEEDRLEKEREEAENKLRKQLTEVAGRYYWEPGKTALVNITLTGRPLLMVYGFREMSYNNGVLSVNPEWIGVKDSMPSYTWARLADKIIDIVKHSEKVSAMVEKALGKIEQHYRIEISQKSRQEIIKWCENIVGRRITAHSYPSPKGKDFLVVEPVITACDKKSFGASPLRTQRDYGASEENIVRENEDKSEEDKRASLLIARELLRVAKSLTGFTSSDISVYKGKNSSGEFVQFELPTGWKY